MTRPPGLAAVAIIMLLLTGCGYSLRGTLPPHIKTVGVPIFTNRTAAPAVEGFITRAVVQAFSTNGRLRVVNPADADAVLDGEVTGYSVAPIAFDSAANVRRLRLTVSLSLVLRDVKRKTILFQQGVTERSDFNVPGATPGTSPSVVSQTVSEEETALRAAAVDIARTIVSLAVERF